MPTLEFKGKQYIYSHHHSVPFRELQVDAKKSLPAKGAKPALDGNLIIHGDNLHALKALMPQYAGKVKCIYIDPPYNTGNEGWCYNDNVNSPLMKEWIKKNANPVDREDLERHDKWLCMMYPRLKLLHELLADDGVIFVSIDDNEVHHLRAAMDEIWGEDNFINQLVWKKKYTGGKHAKYYSDLHEHVLVYARASHLLDSFAYDRPDGEKGKFSQEDEYVKERGKYYTRPLKSNLGERKTLVYPIQFPDGTSAETQWIVSKPTFEKMLKEGRIEFRKKRDGIFQVYKKYYENDGDGKIKPPSIIESTNNNDAKVELKELFGISEGRDNVFYTVKPTELLKTFLQVATEKDSIVLDSFAGSGTTAHAVMALNAEDGGNRKYILVECEDYADTITAERVRRVINGVPTAKNDQLKAGLGGSFAYCTLGAEISIEKILTGEALPAYDALAKYVFYTATGKSLDGAVKEKPDYYVGETDLYEVYLVYKPDMAFLRSNDSALNAAKLDAIAARKSKKEKLVFATAKYMGQKELSQQNITFCQLPYAIHKVVGA